MTSARHVRRKGIAYVAAGIALMTLGGVLNHPAWAFLGSIVLVLVVLQSAPPRASSITVMRTMDEAQRHIEGDAIPVQLTIKTSARVTRLLEVLDAVPRPATLVEGSNYQVLGIKRGADQTLAYAAAVPVFGFHAFGPVRLRAEDPFGFFGTDLSLGSETHVPIEPRPSSLDATHVRSVVPQTLMGQYEVQQPGQGFDFFGLRDYNSSDRMRDVNWKATSRVRRLVVNQHVKESRADVLLLIDAREAELVGHPVHCAFRQSGRIAMEVVDELLRRRDAIRIVLYGRQTHDIPKTGSRRQLRNLLDDLMTREPSGVFPLTKVVDEILPTIPPRSSIVLFSSLLDDKGADDAVTKLIGHGNRLLVFSPRPTNARSGQSPEEALLLADRDETVKAIQSFGCIVVSTEPPTEALAEGNA